MGNIQQPTSNVQYPAVGECPKAGKRVASLSRTGQQFREMKAQAIGNSNGLDGLRGNCADRKSARSNTWRRWVLALSLPAGFAFWFLTAPAGFSVERMAAGNGLLSRFVIGTAETYESPMSWLCLRSATVRTYEQWMSDWWFDVLDAPETTP